MTTRRDETTRKTVWYWQSNSNPFSTTEEKQWTRYNQNEVQCIEEAYTNNAKKVEINQIYFIDLKKMLQISKYDKNKQRPIKREIEDMEQQVTFPSVKPDLGAPGEKLKFVTEWVTENNIGSHYFNEQNAEETVLQAAKGIEMEGRLVGREEEGIRLSKKLQDVKDSSLLKISKICVLVYTIDSFLYKMVNKCLREDDMNKMNTLGPYCFLLINALWMLRRNENVTLYRGLTLDEESLSNYKASIGKQFSWKTFTSTTRDRSIAEHFGNTMFIISVVQMPFKPAYWTPISEYSEFQYEDEVFLPAAVTYIINDIKYDNETKKHIIYVTI
ncbi:unnamed protein product [Adineta ricciae]|uniref:NAD(P)(+)--arginine ADP-ribosyltransferase n=1 Tax=Adineta ricciae TaxID=249248 RepID=A0A816A400_ADIRI|nr:unnamed protein product [Adineta ricciae]CAF1591217.1 unnamed protein product [Adineta ricciae]